MTGTWQKQSLDNGVTTRTCHGGKGQTCFQHRKKAFIEPISSGSSEESTNESGGEDVEEDIDEVDDILEPLPAGVKVEMEESEDGKKPANTRAILEVGGLIDTMATLCWCPCCDASMKPSMTTLCLASTLTVACTNEVCGYIHVMSDAAKAEIGDQSRASRNRSTNYAINVLWVLGFISVGDG
jgi:hypothetical protein